jgi:hypothetical protein
MNPLITGRGGEGGKMKSEVRAILVWPTGIDGRLIIYPLSGTAESDVALEAYLKTMLKPEGEKSHDKEN